MPDLSDMVVSVMLLAYVFLRIGPSISRSFWSLSDVPPPPVLPVSRDIVRPQMAYPAYPFWPQRRGQVGWVAVDIRIDDQGRYLDHEVIGEAPTGMFSASVAKALKTTTYRSHSGFPLPGRIRTVYKFVVPARDGAVPAWAVSTPGVLVHRSRGLLD